MKIGNKTVRVEQTKLKHGHLMAKETLTRLTFGN